MLGRFDAQVRQQHPSLTVWISALPLACLSEQQHPRPFVAIVDVPVDT
jgi:hypothetical protein